MPKRYDGMQNLRSVDVSEEAMSKAASPAALAEELLKALQDGHDQSVQGRFGARASLSMARLGGAGLEPLPELSRAHAGGILVHLSAS